MNRLSIYISIILFVLLNVHVNESKPVFIPLEYLERAWPGELDLPVEHIVCKMMTWNRIKIIF
jgi:hypothetical protein